MQYYFIQNGSQREGPFSIEELKSKGIKKDSLVWREDLPEWIQAGEVKELITVFTDPPAIKKEKIIVDTSEKNNPPTNKFTAKSKTVLVLILFMIATSVGAFFYFKKNKKEEVKNSQPIALTDKTDYTKTDSSALADSTKNAGLKVSAADVTLANKGWDSSAFKNTVSANEISDSDTDKILPPYFTNTNTKKKKVVKKPVSKEEKAKVKEPTTDISDKKPAPVPKNIIPSQYLIANGNFRKNLLLEAVLEGNIYNRSSNIVFRDLVVEVNFMDEHGESLEIRKFSPPGEVVPNQSLSFKFKTRAPKGAKSVKYSVTNAKAEQ